MSRYRKTMRQAIEEGLSNMQIAILKKEYAPFKGKTISAARAKQLMNILDKFKEDDLKKLGKENIPFVSSGSRSKLAVRNMKFKVTNINPFKEEVTQEDFDLEEGKMKTIATMFAQGKSAEDIANAMKLPVATVKNILGEEVSIVYTDKKTRQVVSKKFKNDSEARKWIKQFDGAAGQINFKPSSMLNKEDLDKDDVKTIKPIIKQLQKSVKSHDKQAKQLTKDISDEKGLEEQAKELEEQLKTAEKELEELYIKEDKAYVIRFKRIKDKERMVVVFRNQHDADMYADNIKKQGGQVFSNKLEKIPYKVVDKK